MRLSKTQKDVLIVLYRIASKGVLRPIPGTDLHAMINGSRDAPIAASNFRASCHTLEENGLLDLHRGKDLSLQWQLTKRGAEVTAPLYTAWVEQTQ